MFVFFTLDSYIHWAFNFKSVRRRWGRRKIEAAQQNDDDDFHFSLFTWIILHIQETLPLSLRLEYFIIMTLHLSHSILSAAVLRLEPLLWFRWRSHSTPSAFLSRPIKSSTHRYSHKAQFIWQTCCGDIDDVLKCPHNWARLSFRLFPFPVILCAHRAKRASSSSTYVKSCRCCCCVLILRV